MRSDIRSWRELLRDEFEGNEDAWDQVIACTLDEAGLDAKFNAGFGGINGSTFAIWTGRFVYFPACYDGAEWVSSVPRNPGDAPEPIEHVGGG